MIVETSIIIDNIFNKKVSELLASQKNLYSLRTSYFILFEFKRGFIGNLVRYYLLIKEFGHSDAKRMLSLPGKGRLSNAVNYLDSYIIANGQNILSVDEEALAQIETYITIFLDMFSSALSTPDLLGNSIKNPVIEFDLTDRSNYKAFIELIESNNNPLKLKKFFIGNKDSYKLIVDNPYSIRNKTFRELLASMVVILDCINTDDTRLDEDAKFVLNTNKHVGDSIIAIDLHKNHSIITSDRIFKDLCKTLERKVLIAAKDGSIKANTLSTK